ncbi:MAG: hypothetical protein ARM1_0799 [Candidatus Micrarchaeota archaeon]|nr:MAG: hypothetical protein ARM1_0799 [Candidatus Micrarchaeota archaeon]
MPYSRNLDEGFDQISNEAFEAIKEVLYSYGEELHSNGYRYVKLFAFGSSRFVLMYGLFNHSNKADTIRDLPKRENEFYALIVEPKEDSYSEDLIVDLQLVKFNYIGIPDDLWFVGENGLPKDSKELYKERYRIEASDGELSEALAEAIGKFVYDYLNSQMDDID